MGVEAGATPDLVRERGSWPVRLHRLGAEPGDDLSATTTPEARLAMMWPLALEAWTLTGAPLPGYSRHETPLARRPWPPARRTPTF